MTAISRSMYDWSYDEAAQRLRKSATLELRAHRARVRLDIAGNRVASCGCGWKGNGLGWLQHIDHVISGSLRD